MTTETGFWTYACASTTYTVMKLECCYLVIHIENLLHPLQMFYFHFWPIYWISLVYVVLCAMCSNLYNMGERIDFEYVIYFRPATESMFPTEHWLSTCDSTEYTPTLYYIDNSHRTNLHVPKLNQRSEWKVGQKQNVKLLMIPQQIWAMCVAVSKSIQQRWRAHATCSVPSTNWFILKI
jgi:hypothetical protein